VIDPAKGRTWLYNSGMSMLLLLLVAIVFVIPVVVSGPALHLMWDVLLTLILVSGVVAVAEHRKLAIALAVLSVVVIVMALIERLVPAGLAPQLRRLSTLGAFLLLAIAVGINVFAFGHAVGDRLFGAVVLYLLLGLIWAVAYQLVDSVLPGAFAGHAGGSAGIADWAYFSFVTLTTVGYGDITPVALAARSLAILEALVGQLYPAVIIARLVSLQVSSP
jgi:Ion channel